VRLEGIDAPEHGQLWSAQATQKLADLVLNRTVKVLAIRSYNPRRVVCVTVVPPYGQSEYAGISSATVAGHWPAVTICFWSTSGAAGDVTSGWRSWREGI
jgi:hypothetical protein